MKTGAKLSRKTKELREGSKMERDREDMCLMCGIYLYDDVLV